jgi:hypothetical protein
VTRRHVRFELLDVMIDSQPVGKATIDAWEDDAAVSRWAARIPMKAGHGSVAGMLTGSTRDGRRLAGRVTVGVDAIGPKGGTVIVDLHGEGPLTETTTPDSADA